MEKARVSKARLAERGLPHEWEKLICKLRWIGLDDAHKDRTIAIAAPE
jgi:hypothetical protein